MEVNIYNGFWILKMKCTQCSICGKVAFKNARAMDFSKSGGGGISFRLVPKNVDFLLGRLALPVSTSLKKILGGGLMSTLVYYQPTIIGML